MESLTILSSLLPASLSSYNLSQQVLATDTKILFTLSAPPPSPSGLSCLSPGLSVVSISLLSFSVSCLQLLF